MWSSAEEIKMLDLDAERADLGKADRHIAEGEKRLAGREREVQLLRRLGLSTLKAERSLDLFRETLQAWQQHRMIIEQTIAVRECSRRRPKSS
jgi:hypothetical protein